MKSYYSLTPQPDLPPTAVALGLFDGVHRGHCAVLGKVLEDYKNEGLIPCVFTFTSSNSIPGSKKGSQWIYTESMKERVFEKVGMQIMFCPDFSEFSQMTPEEFVKNVLVETFHAKKVSCGEDFRFGQKALGTVEDLQRLSQPFGIEAQVIAPILQEEGVISSTRIRKCLMEGDIQSANTMLGRPYAFDFVVERGRQLGRKIHSPTINQRFQPGYLIPRFGVYASQVVLEGRYYPGVTYIGIKPTVGGEELPLAETYILGFEGDLYGQSIEVGLLEYLREERKFDSLQELSAQIQANARSAQKIFEEKGQK